MVSIEYNFINDIENLYLITELRSRLDDTLISSDLFYKWYEISESDTIYSSAIFRKIVTKNINFARTSSNLDLELSYLGFAYQTQGFDYHADAVWPENQDDRAMGKPTKEQYTYTNYNGTWVPNYVSSRKFTTVLYLNDNFEGGETDFPTLKLSVKPEKNKIIGFRCDENYVHGVIPTSNGIRKTFICWFE